MEMLRCRHCHLLLGSNKVRLRCTHICHHICYLHSRHHGSQQPGKALDIAVHRLVQLDLALVLSTTSRGPGVPQLGSAHGCSPRPHRSQSGAAESSSPWGSQDYQAVWNANSSTPSIHACVAQGLGSWPDILRDIPAKTTDKRDIVLPELVLEGGEVLQVHHALDTWVSES